MFYLMSHQQENHMTQPSHISLPQFEELRALLDEDFVDLIHTYMQDSLQRLSEMETAYANLDNRLGYNAAHGLKGASSNLGATELTELCYKLQEICRTGHINQHEQLIEEIKAECHAVNDQIQSLIA